MDVFTNKFYKVLVSALIQADRKRSQRGHFNIQFTQMDSGSIGLSGDFLGQSWCLLSRFIDEDERVVFEFEGSTELAELLEIEDVKSVTPELIALLLKDEAFLEGVVTMLDKAVRYMNHFEEGVHQIVRMKDSQLEELIDAGEVVIYTPREEELEDGEVYASLANQHSAHCATLPMHEQRDTHMLDYNTTRWGLIMVRKMVNVMALVGGTLKH